MNQDIFEKCWKLDQETRRFKDPNLLKEATEVTMKYRQEHNMAKINTNIAESQLKDYENQKEMAETLIRDLLKEKRVIDKSILEIELKVSSQGMSDPDQKKKLFEAEKELLMKYTHQLQWARDHAEVILELLKDEEKKCKEMLDLKITAQ